MTWPVECWRKRGKEESWCDAALAVVITGRGRPQTAFCMFPILNTHVNINVLLILAHLYRNPRNYPTATRRPLTARRPETGPASLPSPKECPRRTQSPLQSWQRLSRPSPTSHKSGRTVWLFWRLRGGRMNRKPNKKSKALLRYTPLQGISQNKKVVAI